MKNQITVLIILCSILLASCTKITIPKNDLQEENLKGRVAVLAEYSFKAIEESGKIEKGNRHREDNLFEQDKLVSYNTDGNKVYSSYYYSYGALKDSIRYKYSMNGLLRKTIQYNFYRKKVYKNTYSYKKQNKELIIKTKGKSKHKDFSDRSVTYKYDSLGNEIKMNPSGTVYEYDEKGNIIVETDRNQDGAILFKKYYQYDEQGRLLSTTSTQAIIQFLSEGQSFETKYDDRMNIVQVKIFNFSGELERTDQFKYQYDELGNWVKKIKYIDSIPKFIIERHIEYLPIESANNNK
ncbi:MAG TPA: RHS repeat domain-containing protein [Bacteroidales bacterium]|nr:RHS repeat domain-containing protein [Bacteroidales bacterium]